MSESVSGWPSGRSSDFSQQFQKCRLRSSGILGQEKFAAEIYAKCGNVNFARSNYQRAVLDYSNAAKYDESKSHYVFQLAKCLQEMGEVQEALRFYQLALERSPVGSVEAANIRLRRGVMLARGGKFSVNLPGSSDRFH